MKSSISLPTEPGSVHQLGQHPRDVEGSNALQVGPEGIEPSTLGLKVPCSTV